MALQEPPPDTSNCDGFVNMNGLHICEPGKLKQMLATAKTRLV